MSHSSTPITLAPCLSSMVYSSTPFSGHDGAIGVLVLDVEMNHIDIEFHQLNAGKNPITVDHSSGKVMLEMPANLSGVAAEQALLDDRGLESLKHLMLTADLTDAGVAIRSPKEYTRHLAFLLARAQDFAALGASITLDAMAMSLTQLSLIGVGESGNAVKKFSSAVAFKDRATGQWLDSQDAIDAVVTSRSRDSLAHGILIRGLDERLFELMQVTASDGLQRAANEETSSLQQAKKGSGTFSSFMKKLSEADDFVLTYGEQPTVIKPSAKHETAVTQPTKCSGASSTSNAPRSADAALPEPDGGSGAQAARSRVMSAGRLRHRSAHQVVPCPLNREAPDTWGLRRAGGVLSAAVSQIMGTPRQSHGLATRWPLSCVVSHGMLTPHAREPLSSGVWLTKLPMTGWPIARCIPTGASTRHTRIGRLTHPSGGVIRGHAGHCSRNAEALTGRRQELWRGS